MKNLIRHTAGLPVNLAYIDAGEGAPVIFVHEFAGDMMSWLPPVSYTHLTLPTKRIV